MGAWQLKPDCWFPSPMSPTSNEAPSSMPGLVSGLKTPSFLKGKPRLFGPGLRAKKPI
jgi:hypothetical protein